MANNSSDSYNNEDEQTLAGGILDTTEARIVDLLSGRQRNGILKPMLMNKWSDALPLTGFRPKIREETGHAQYKSRDIDLETKMMYSDYGQLAGASHPSKPPEAMLPAATTKLGFKTHAKQSYERGTSVQELDTSVIDMSKLIYGLMGHKKESLHWNMSGSAEVNKTTERARFIEAREDAAAIICCHIMRSNKKIARALPVKLNQAYVRYANDSIDTQKPTGNWPEHFAASIEFTDGRTTLLPLVIHLVTSRPIPFEEAELALHSANKSKPLPGKCALPWDCYTRPELQEKFENMPLMNISDATFLIPPLTRHATADVDKETFYPRIYSSTWLWKPNLQKGEALFPPYYGMSVESWRDAGKVWQNCERVSKASYIGEAIQLDGSTVTWKKNKQPVQPFTVVSLTDFTCNAIKSAAKPNIEEYINGTLSCGAYYDCPEDVWDGSGMCKKHRLRLLEQLAAGKPLSAKDLPEVQEPKDIKWSLNLGRNNADAIRLRLEALHGAFNEKNIWVVDFEGFCVANKGYTPIPLRIGIVNLGTGKSDTGLIKYNFDHIGSMADAIIAGGALPSRADRKRVGGVLRRHYGGTKVTGYTLSMWKFRLLDMGFDTKNDLVVSWGFTNFDRLSMGRIMAVNSNFAVKTESIELKAQHLDLAQVFKTHSSIATTALSFVYRTYVKDDHEHRWHDPIYDAQATKDLWTFAKRYTEPLFKEIRKLYKAKKGTPSNV